MNLTEIRESLESVSDAVPVPAPDPLAFRRRVARTRRRRTAGRVAGAVAAVVVLGGSAGALSLGDDPGGHTVPADRTATEPPGSVPVLVENHVRRISPDGVLGPELVGPVGPDIATLVGVTPHGVVVLTDGGVLARIDEEGRHLDPLVPEQVRSAYLDGDAVVYENEEGLIRWHGIEPEVVSSHSAQTEDGRLMAAGPGMAVIAEDDGLMLHDPQGVHELFLDPDVVHAIRGVDAAAGVVAVRTDAGVDLFYDHGRFGSALPGDRIGALAPDGHAYARPTDSGRTVQLLDPRTANATPVEGPDGSVVGLGWSDHGELLVVVQSGEARTLWRCSSTGTGCSAVLDDDTATLRLR